MNNIANAIINEMIAITIDIISNAVIGTTSLLLQVREAIHLVHDYSMVLVYYSMVYFSILPLIVNLKYTYCSPREIHSK